MTETWQSKINLVYMSLYPFQQLLLHFQKYYQCLLLYVKVIVLEYDTGPQEYNLIINHLGLYVRLT